MEKIFLGQYHVTTSAIVHVEVCGSISRRVGMNKATSVKNQLIRWENMNLIAYRELTRKRREVATELTVKLKMRGMDAMVVQVAKEKGRVLITFDEKMAEKDRAAVEFSLIKILECESEGV